jgi:protein-disulfide isomerase
MMKFSGHIAIIALLVGMSGCDAASTKKPGTTAAKGDKVTSVANRANWVDVTSATPEGGFRIGNPDAKVKLLEFASMTCPHCKDFHEHAFEALKTKYIASGNVSYEYRNFVLNGPDYAASMLARCQGAEPFFGLLKAFYTDQASWTEPFTKLTPADSTRIGALPQDKQIAALAEAGKLDAYARLRGIPRAKFDACLTNKAALDKLIEMRTQAVDTYKLTGTPGFIINGKTQDNVYTWDQLEPKLIAALQ